LFLSGFGDPRFPCCFISFVRLFLPFVRSFVRSFRSVRFVCFVRFVGETVRSYVRSMLHLLRELIRNFDSRSVLFRSGCVFVFSLIRSVASCRFVVSLCVELMFRCCS